ncbi:hypothetical protein HDU80_010873, partial [Chytriomyces hyalinus]
MTDWPSSVTKISNFNEKELEILEQNPVSLVESTHQADGFDGISSRMPVDENGEQESTGIQNQRNLSGSWMGSCLAVGEMQVLDVAMSFNSAHLDTPACDGTEQTRESTMDLNGADLDAL